MADGTTAATLLLERAERRRVELSNALADARLRSEHGQFFTPAKAALLIARMPSITGPAVRVLDPGAGSGMLSAAFVARWLADAPEVVLEIVAVERDPAVAPILRDTLEDCEKVAADLGASLTTTIVVGDFIDISTGLDQKDDLISGFNLVIQNPPYAKMPASSPQRDALRWSGVDTPNLYAAFLALGARALDAGGQLVAITPRSFCNGPYFGAFRSYLLDRISLDRVHVFASRSTVFADTAVLQENVVFSGTLDGQRETVTVSESTGYDDEATTRVVPYAEVVHPDDPHRFIRITTSDVDTATAERMMALPATLADLGLTASTGRVVDFRSRECLRHEAEGDALPLVYPANLRDGRVEWPRSIRKAQWFAPACSRDDAMLMPEGWYCVIKRFSAKEERRRIVAAVWSPLDHAGRVAFENHVNVIHESGEGLDPLVVRGLCLWLNSTLVDRFFRTFSGHTQVNATDLRSLRYPDTDTLRRLGDIAPKMLPAQKHIDTLVDGVLSGAGDTA